MKSNQNRLLFIFLFFAISACSIQDDRDLPNQSADTSHDEFTSLTGTWTYSSEGDGPAGSLSVLQTEASALKFYLDVNRGAPSYNMGIISGCMHHETAESWMFEADDDYLNCSWRAEFKDDELTITTLNGRSDCGFGMGVRADGTYEKTSADPEHLEIREERVFVTGSNEEFEIEACDSADYTSELRPASGGYLNAVMIRDDLRNELISDMRQILEEAEEPLERDDEFIKRGRSSVSNLVRSLKEYVTRQENQYAYTEEIVLEGEITGSGVHETLVMRTFVSAEDTSFVHDFQFHRDSNYLSATRSEDYFFLDEWSILIHDARLSAETMNRIRGLSAWMYFIARKEYTMRSRKIDFSELNNGIPGNEKIAPYLAQYDGHCIDFNHPWGFDGQGVCQFWYEPTMRWVTVEIGYEDYYVQISDME